jgi:outer membrane receptor protein involved in Fe transport
MSTKKIIFMFFILLSSVFAFGQQGKKIAGTVKDADNLPLPGASVQVEGTSRVTLTDTAGRFVLQNILGSKISIRVSYVGNVSQTKAVDLSAGDVTGLEIKLAADPMSLNEVVITGVTNPVSKLESSVSISTLNQTQLNNAAPRTTAELFRSIPGIRAEASGGDGNTNITVRGVPISAGGSKYLQLQEDGLPVLQFGDIAFGTSDIFLRADNTVSRIEAIRGGSAATLGSNSPAGIINFISKNGSVESGAISTTIGLDYGSFRTDFNYGTPLSESISFNIGGFYRTGEGARTAGYNANNGGQIKANLTKKFDKGYVRFYFKYLNDRTPAYMPAPIQVSGTNSNPDWASISTFNAKTGTMYTPFIQKSLGLGNSGELRSSNLSDGMHPVSTSFGSDFKFNLDDNWIIDNKMRMSLNNGSFISFFPSNIGSVSNLLSSISTATGGAVNGASLNYADGSAYTGQNAAIMALFDVDLNNFNNFVNDFRISKSFGDKVNLNFGLYKSFQNISMSWFFKSYLTDLNGEGLKPLNIVNAANNTLTQNGLFAYGTPIWGGGSSSYDLQYNISAPYFSINLKPIDKLNIDGSIRYDRGNVNGTYATSNNTAYDVNNDGSISAVERNVSAINLSGSRIVNYTYDYFSYSLGLNYMLTQNQAVFARYSKGASAKADRLMGTSNLLSNGSATGTFDEIKQAEVGYKYNYKKGGLFVTGFYAGVNEAGGFEVTSQNVIRNNYNSYGIELENIYRISSRFDLRATATYTHARLSSGVNEGNRPRRQADLIYSLSPTYTIKKLSAGLVMVGTTKAYAQDNNLLVMPGYIVINPFVNYNVTKGLSISVNANNVTNSLGITEAEEGAITENVTNIVRARSITGRTISATLAYKF